MAPLQFDQFDVNYQNTFGNTHIQQYEVYTDQGERVGQVSDALVNDSGQFQQLIVNLDSSIANKRVPIPFSYIQVEQRSRRAYVSGLTRSQIESLPTYQPSSVSQTGVTQIPTQPTTSTVSQSGVPVETSPLLDDSAPLEGWTRVEEHHPSVISSKSAGVPVEDRGFEQRQDAYSTPQELPTVPPQNTLPRNIPVDSTYTTSDVAGIPPSQPSPEVVDERTVRLLEERLVVNSGQRRKVGEVIVRKEIETRIVEVPVRREKLIVEQVSPHKQLAVVDLRELDSDAGVEVHEATSTSSRPIVRGNFTSAEAASRFLDAIAHHPDTRYQSIQICITLDDPQLQSLYQQWLEQYRT